jgi:hexokinase
MADVPKDLQQEIRRLEEVFTIDGKKLKQITEHFVKELAKGMIVVLLSSHGLSMIWLISQLTTYRT